ncbi:MAG: thermonuclease family protein, partial [Chloroflexota bacterium]
GKNSWIGLAVIAAIVIGVIFLIRSGNKGGDEQARANPTATSVAGAVDPAEAPLACGEFDTQMWAQTIFDDNPRAYADLDPDGDGFACEELPYGPVPALWTSRIPANAEPAQLDFTIDGDTIAITDQQGRQEHVRLVGIDTPETGKGTRPLECYGNEASDFTRDLFANGGSTVYLEIDQEDRDKYGRLLRWVWIKDQRTGQVYLTNEVIVRSGYAERYRNTPNRRYVNQVMDAETFAERHDYGLWGAC